MSEKAAKLRGYQQYSPDKVEFLSEFLTGFGKGCGICCGWGTCGAGAGVAPGGGGPRSSRTGGA